MLLPRWSRSALATALLASTLTTVQATPALAVGAFEVNTTADTVDVALGDSICADVDGKCSLRAAVMELNSSPFAFDIDIPPGTYTLTRSVGDDLGRHGDLDIRKNVTITGSGPGVTIIDGFGNDRVFDVHLDFLPPSDSVNFEDLTIFNGATTGDGGGIRVRGTGAWSATDVDLVENHAGGSGGGIHDSSTYFHSMSTIRLTNNTADGDGGGMFGNANYYFDGFEAVGNRAGGNGGGLVIDYTSGGPGTSVEGLFADNVAGGDGGGWYVANDTATTNPVKLVTMTGNQAAGRGGGLFLANVPARAMERWSIADNAASIGGAGIWVQAPSVFSGDALAIVDNVGPGADCGGTLAGSSLTDSVVGTCAVGTLTATVTGSTGGLAPLAPNLADKGRMVRLPQPGWIGLDAHDSPSCAGQARQQPPLAPADATACDVGAAELPTTIVVDVLTDTVPGAVDACTNGLSPCSLRGAVELGSAGFSTTVVLGAGTHQLVNGPVVPTSQSIIGSGSQDTMIDASAATSPQRVMAITSDTTVVLRGLSMSGGRVPVAPGAEPSASGGGLLVTGLGSTGTLAMADVVFRNNAAADDGGGMALRGEGNITFNGVSFNDNTARKGAGLSWSGSPFQGDLFDVTFQDNGKAVPGYPRTEVGGGFHCQNCQVLLSRALFKDNVASSAGGGMSAVSTGSIVAPRITNTTFAGNHVGPGAKGSLTSAPGSAGGGLYISSTDDGEVLHNTFLDNTSQDQGGGFWGFDGTAPNELGLLNFHANAFGGNQAADGTDHCATFLSTGSNNMAVGGPGPSCSADGVVEADFMATTTTLGLKALANNGGSVLTAMPLPWSDVLDNGGNECRTNLNKGDLRRDARGGVRAADDGNCDVGAVDLPRPDATLEADLSWVRAPAVVPIASLPEEAIASVVDQARDAAEGGVSSTPMSAIDILASPMSAIPMSAIPMSAIVLADLPFASAVLATMLLVDVPVIGGWEPLLVGSALQGVPLQTLTVADVLRDPVARVAFEGLDLGQVDIASTPMSAIPMSAIAMGALPMSAIPINPANAGNEAAVLADWCAALLAQGFACSDLGINPDVPSSADGWNIAALALAGVPMSAIPMSAIPMSAIDISATPMSAIPMSAIDINSTPMSAIPMSAIDIAGTPMSAIPMSAIPMSAIPMSAIPMSAIPMSAIDISTTPMSAIPMSAIPVGTLANVVDCALVNCATATLGQAFTAGAIKPDATIGDLGDALDAIRLRDVIGAMVGESLAAATAARNNPESRLTDLDPYADLTLGELFAFGELTLGELVDILEAAGLFGPGGALEGMTLDDLFGGLLPFTDYPWEDIDLSAFSAQLFADDATPIPYNLSIAAVDPLPGYRLDLSVTLPPGFVYVPGSTISGDGFGEPSVSGSGTQLNWNLTDVQATVVPVTMAFSAYPSIGASAENASITATLVDYGTSVTRDATTNVYEALEPNNIVALSTRAEPDNLYVTQLSHPEDVDIFQIDVAAGDRLSVILSDLPADYDLVLFSPDTDPLPLRAGTDRQLLPMDDEGLNLIGPSILEPQPLNDINLGPAYIDGTGPDVYGTSARRGLEDEKIDTPPLPRAGTYRIQVSGYDGAFSSESYTLRMTIRPGIELPACDPIVLPFAGEGVAPLAPPAVPGDLDTLILVNQTRLGDTFGDAEVNAPGGLLANLDTFVTESAALGLTAMVYPVDAHVAIRNAYDAWDADAACHPDTANDVARAIGEVITSIRDSHPTLENVVIVGADDQIPFARVPDRTSLANETGYYNTFTGNNPLVGSLARGFLLSDEPYGDDDPISLGSRDFFVTDLALGRVVEDVEDIEAAFAKFLLFDGLLDAGSGSSAFVAGYDFLTDGSNEIGDLLGAPPHTVWPDPLGRTVDRLVNETWDRTDLETQLFDGDNAIVSLNAHFDHNRALPALGNATHDESDLFEVPDLLASVGATLDGTVLFSMGCHSGLSVSDVQILSPGDNPADWAQNFAGAGTSAYVGNTGFGYGDTEVVALSEELMSNFAGFLDGTDTVGAAFLYAKQRYVANLGANGVYDEKVVMEATFYGLPMYRLENPPVATSNTQDEPAASAWSPVFADDAGPGGVDSDDEADLIRMSIGTNAIESLSFNSGARGGWYAYEDYRTPQQQVTHFRPIQPIGTYDVTFMDTATGNLRLDIRGVKIRELYTSAIFTNFDPVITRPILADGANEAEPNIGEVVWPATPANVTKVVTPGGTRTQLNVMFGQFRGGSDGTPGSKVTGQQRQHESVNVDLFYGALDAPDKLPPRLDRVDAWEDAVTGNIEFRIEALDASPFLEANVLYIEAGTTGDWVNLDLIQGPALPGGRAVFTGTVTDPNPGSVGSIEFFAQVVDQYGNVGVSSNKGTYHLETDAPPIIAAPTIVPTFLFNDRGATSSWFRTAANVKLVDFESGTTLSVDGGDFVAVPGGGIDVTTDGEHVLTARQPTQGDITTLLRVDRTAPTLTIQDPANGVEVFQSFPPSPNALCKDLGSGISKCTVDPIVTSSLGGPFALQAKATDRAGNTTTTSTTYTVVADDPKLFDTTPDPDPDPTPGPGPTPTPNPTPTPDPTPDPTPTPDPGPEVEEPRGPWPGPGLQWLFGPNRYHSAALLSQERYPDGNSVVYVGTGTNFPDLLALASITQDNLGPILLVNKTGIPAETAKELERLRPRRIVVIGGTTAVSDEVYEQLRAFTPSGGRISLAQALSTAPPPIERIAGPDRYATAALAALRGFPDGAQRVVLVTGEKFPDAMVAGALAATYDAPVILTRSTTLSVWANHALAVLEPVQIIVVGGTSAVSDAVLEAARQSAGHCNAGPCETTARRISAGDRYATAAAVALEFDAPVDTVYVTGGQAWPDGLGVMPIAQADGSPVLLVERDRIPEATLRALERLQPLTIGIVGGPSIISEAVARQLGEHVRGSSPADPSPVVLSQPSAPAAVAPVRRGGPLP